MMDRVRAWLVPRLIYAVYRLLDATIRWREVGSAHARDPEARFILCFWHARMLLMPRPFVGRPGYMLISEHRDGGYIADAMRLIGIDTVRGSSTRAGARAMLALVRRARREGCSLGITPDGPRGPRERVKPGAVQLAKKTGLPLLPVCYATEHHWRVNSWDRFYLPRPFSRGVFVFGEYLRVAPDDDVAEACRRLQAAMDEVQRRADTFFAARPGAASR